MDVSVSDAALDLVAMTNEQRSIRTERRTRCSVSSYKISSIRSQAYKALEMSMWQRAMVSRRSFRLVH